MLISKPVTVLDLCTGSVCVCVCVCAHVYTVFVAQGFSLCKTVPFKNTALLCPFRAGGLLHLPCLVALLRTAGYRSVGVERAGVSVPTSGGHPPHPVQCGVSCGVCGHPPLCSSSVGCGAPGLLSSALLIGVFS